VAAPRSVSPDSGRVTVPKLNRDPIQSLQPWPVTIWFHRREFVVPALSAAEWLAVLMTPEFQLDDVFPGLLPHDQEELVEELILDGQLANEDFRAIGLGTIETASAREWWVALRLVEMARSSWDVLGAELALRGIDASRISLASWLDVLLLTALRNMDPKDTQMFTLRLEAPPAEADVEPQELEMSRDAFLSMAGQ
jgi:hypothetical protein